ncbi:hypothetical protein [Moraxella sp. ZY200743]|uniref:hypothetical protein n=1 Tax=Moraxella sp. ZY200743 TaxID=2911970 RepID=UPI003D7EE3D8
MKFELKPLEWNMQGHDEWQAVGIKYTYTIKPEHKRLRLACADGIGRIHLFDFDEHYDAMAFAERHHLNSIRPYIKEVCDEPIEFKTSI